MILGTTSWITTVTGYDDKAMPIFIATENSYLDTQDYVLNLYDFVGNILKTVLDRKSIDLF